MTTRLGVYAAAIGLLFGASPAASDTPPPGSKPLSEIAAIVEKSGYSPIEEAAFEDGSWEVEARQGGTKYELRVDPISGEIKSKRVDD